MKEGDTLEEALKLVWQDVKGAEDEFFMSRDSDYIVYENGIRRTDIKIVATDDDKDIPSMLNVLGEERTSANDMAVEVFRRYFGKTTKRFVVITHVHT